MPAMTSAQPKAAALCQITAHESCKNAKRAFAEDAASVASAYALINLILTVGTLK